MHEAAFTSFCSSSTSSSTFSTRYNNNAVIKSEHARCLFTRVHFQSFPAKKPSNVYKLEMFKAASKYSKKFSL